jgi:hypothetical protein
MVIRTRYLSWLELAELHHNSSVSRKTGKLSDVDEALVFLKLMAYYGMFS